jgi:CelD/BcsL family acetyltransferase involved in cellulose biosynthesis
MWPCEGSVTPLRGEPDQMQMPFELEREIREQPGAAPAGLEVRILGRADIDAPLIDRWARLEARSLEANAYLSPHFVVPALRHLTPELAVEIVAVFDRESANAPLVGLGVFSRRSPTRRMPFPTLCAYRSPHSFLTGLLIDRDLADRVADAFFGYFGSRRNRWCAVEFVDLRQHGPLLRALQGAARRAGARWHPYDRRRRAVLDPHGLGERPLEGRLDPHDAAELRRKRRRLAERGAVSWRLVDDGQVRAEQVETFLALEHRGWKAEQGSSLRSQPAHETFFRELVDGFRAAGRAFFCELQLDGCAIASSSNLLSGDAAFAFKIGWDPAYAKSSPGILNEIEFIEHASERFGTLEYIDSGAQPGSFIDSLWTQRVDLVTGAFLSRGIPATLEPLLAALRRIKSRLRGD